MARRGGSATGSGSGSTAPRGMSSCWSSPPGLDVRAVVVDAGAEVLAGADRSVAGDDGLDVAGDVVEQLQRGEVVVGRVARAALVEHGGQDVGEQVAGDEHTAFLDQQ